jgi:type IV pilus assembly protein PilQ
VNRSFIKYWVVFSVIGNFGWLNTTAYAADSRKPASVYEKRFSVNFRNTSVKDALQLIASKGELKLRFDSEVDGKVNFAVRDATLEDALEKISDENDLDYHIKDGYLVVTQKPDDASENAAEPGAKVDNSGATAAGTVFDLAYRSVPLYFVSARDVETYVKTMLHKNEAAVIDEGNNALIVYGSEATYNKVKSFVALYDKRPAQILIEGQIVQTTKSFAKDLGLTFGDPNVSTGAAPSLGVGFTPSVTSAPTLFLRGLMGSIDGRALEARLTAAESTGDAKIVSRPKVFTLNNKKASIHSGVTFHIKTLSAVSSGGTSGGTTGGTATGGVKEITAGLNLEVTPTIVTDGLVRLMIKVQNSTPSTTSSVDGIPGINDNTAETSILVKGGQTATMAGLLTNNVNNTQTSAPFLSKLPLIGWLFKGVSDKDDTAELMIFITPYIVDVLGDKATAEAARAPASIK